MDRIGVGLVGYGLGGKVFHAPFVEDNASLDLRCVVSGDAEKVHRDLPAVEVVPSVAALLERDGIDLVIVSSPDALHAEHALAALEADKHVVIDKPFATDLADARKIAAIAQARDRLVTVFHNRRWDADFRTVRRIIASGMLGTVTQLASHFDRWRPVPKSGWKEARHGGSWLDLGPHLVDQAICLFGRPLSVNADIATLRAESPAPDYFDVSLEYPGHRVILHSSKLVFEHGLRFAVHGSKGSWIKHGTDPQEAAIVGGRSPGGDGWGIDSSPGLFTGVDAPPEGIVVPNEPGDYRLFWGELALALGGGGPNPVPPMEAIAVMEVLDAGLRSAAERRVIAL